MARFREPDPWLDEFSKPGLIEQCASRLDGERARVIKRDIVVEPGDRAATEALQSIMEAQ